MNNLLNGCVFPNTICSCELTQRQVTNNVSKNAVPGGWDADALPLYVARARYEVSTFIPSHATCETNGTITGGAS